MQQPTGWTLAARDRWRQAIFLAGRYVAQAESGAEPTGIIEVAGPREENLAELARMLVARRGTPVTVTEVRDPADPDAGLQATGGLLPGPGARLAGPTFAEWLDRK